MNSLFATTHIGNFAITVYIQHAGVYLKTFEANGAAPSNAAVAVTNLFQLLFWWREVQI